MGYSVNLVERDILDSLVQSGSHKRKGEEQLFQTYSYFIREGVHEHSLSQDDAFDAYSDTILTAIEKISNGSFERRSSLKTYVYKIFHNKCVDLVRKKTANKYSVHQTAPITDMMLHISDAAKSVIQKMIEKTEWETLKAKLNELGETCRQLLLLSADGYTDKEIAVVLEYKTADVVKTSRLRCLDKLRQMYKIK